MRALILGLAGSVAALAAMPATGAAQQSDRIGFRGASTSPSFDVGFVAGRDDRRFNRRRGNDGSVIIYDRDYQGDTTWRSDSFNDWWHDKPERSYPRWMVSNQNCDRMWWGGGAWRC